MCIRKHAVLILMCVVSPVAYLCSFHLFWQASDEPCPWGPGGESAWLVVHSIAHCTARRRSICVIVLAISWGFTHGTYVPPGALSRSMVPGAVAPLGCRGSPESPGRGRACVFGPMLMHLRRCRFISLLPLVLSTHRGLVVCHRYGCVVTLTVV